MRAVPRTTLPLAALALLAAGCLGEPELEDQWTRLDFVAASVAPGQAIAASESLAVSVDLTYRRIVTGFAVAELRASSTLAPGEVSLRPGVDRLVMANDVDRVLRSSVSIGRATRAVTGWDHLIQRIDFRFRATVPAVVDSGAVTGLFLVCYLGSGDEIELADGSDSLVVTPLASVPNQLLPVGMALAAAAPGSR